VSSDMRQNRSCRNDRPIKILNRSGPTIQNLHAGDLMAHTPEIFPKLPTSAWNFSFCRPSPV
jgi:hypothetical protein